MAIVVLLLLLLRPTSVHVEDLGELRCKSNCGH